MNTSKWLKPPLHFSLLGSIVALGAMFAPNLVHAQACTLTAGGASYAIPAASHYDGSQTSNFTGVGTGDYLFEDGWWFRVQGDTQESFFPAPNTTTCAGASGTISWTDVSARGLFDATNTLTLTSSAAGSGELALTMTITNRSAVNPLTISVFHGADFDVNGTAGTDSATLLTANNRIRITDATSGFAEYGGVNSDANAFLVRPFAATTDVFGVLGDALVTNFDNTTLPSNNFDFTGAFQWNLVIPPSGSASVTALLHGNSALPAASVSEIAVSGNGTNIVDGDTTPSTADHTDFGNAGLAGTPVDRTFTISNSSAGNLTLGTVGISGANAGDFSIITQPTSPVANGGTTTFQVRFAPTALGLRQATLSFSNNDSDENPFDFAIQGTGIDNPPTISDVANQTIDEDTSLAPTAVTVGDVETSANALVLTATSSNTTLVPNANITLAGTNANRTVSVTPVANLSGNTTITLQVADGNGGTATDTFVLTVNPVNDLPGFLIGGNRSHPAGTNAAQSFADGATGVTDGDVDFTQALTFNVSNDNNALFSAQPAIDATGTLTYTPTGTGGTATVTVSLTDDATAGGPALSTGTETFTITVANNTLPTITALPDTTIIANGNTGALPFTVGDSETAVASLIVSGTSSNQTLVPDANIVFGGSGASRTVTVTPVPGQSGTATITITLTDGNGGSVTDSFVLTVNVNTAVGGRPIPTLSAWSLLLLIAVFGWLGLRRSRLA